MNKKIKIFIDNLNHFLEIIVEWVLIKVFKVSNSTNLKLKIGQ